MKRIMLNDNPISKGVVLWGVTWVEKQQHKRGPRNHTFLSFSFAQAFGRAKLRVSGCLDIVTLPTAESLPASGSTRPAVSRSNPASSSVRYAISSFFPAFSLPGF